MRDTSIRGDNLDQWWKLSKAEKTILFFFCSKLTFASLMLKKGLREREKKKKEERSRRCSDRHHRSNIFFPSAFHKNKFNWLSITLSVWLESKSRNKSNQILLGATHWTTSKFSSSSALIDIKYSIYTISYGHQIEKNSSLVACRANTSVEKEEERREKKRKEKSSTHRDSLDVRSFISG